MASFLWGANGEEVTPEEIAQRREMAQALLQRGQEVPAYNWAQGAANIMNSFMGGFMQGRAMKAERANDDYNKAMVAALSGDGAFGGAGTDASDPQVNSYLGSDEAMKLAGPQAQSDPFAGAGTDPNNPVTRDTETPSGISPVAHALLSPAQPTVGQAYLAHFAGAPTATNLVQSDPNTPISQIMSPQQVAANPFLRGMTAGQVQDWAAQKMGGSGTPPTQAQQPQFPANNYTQAPEMAATQAQAGPSMSALMGVMSDPRANQQTRGMASALLQNQLQLQQVQQRYQMEQADPENVARRRYYDAETQRIMNQPQRQGAEYRLLSPQEKQTLGLPAGGNYQMDATGKVSAIGGGGVNVLPSAPAGYYYQPGPDGQATLQPVPGGPVDQAKKNKSDSNTTTNDVLTRTASDLFGLLKSNPRLSAGALSIPLVYSPESSAAQLRRLNSTLGAIGSLSSLQQMRDQSPTGGALGNVTEKEEALLARKFGTLDPNSSPDVYEKNARDYVKTLYQIVNGNEAGQSLFNKHFSESTPQSSQANPSVSDMISAAKPIAPGVSYRKGN